MTDLLGACVLGIVDENYHTVVEAAGLITISRGFNVEAKPMLTPPHTIWLYFYDADGKRVLDSGGNAVKVKRS